MLLLLPARVAPLLLLLLPCLLQVVAASQIACQKDPVIVYLDRGQKVTVSYWLGEEPRHEVTELPKPSRRPSLETKTSPPPTSPYTVTDASAASKAPIDEENTIPQHPSSDQDTLYVTSTVSDFTTSELPPSQATTSVLFNGTTEDIATEAPKSDTIVTGTTETIVNASREELNDNATEGIISSVNNDINNDVIADSTSFSFVSTDSSSTEKHVTEGAAFTDASLKDSTKYDGDNATVTSEGTSISESTTSVYISTSDVTDESTVSSVKSTDSSSTVQDDLGLTVTSEASSHSSVNANDPELSTTPSPTVMSSTSPSTLITEASTVNSREQPLSNEEYVDLSESEQSDAKDSDVDRIANESSTSEVKTSTEADVSTESNVLSTISSFLTSLFTKDDITSSEHYFAAETQVTEDVIDEAKSTEKRILSTEEKENSDLLTESPISTMSTVDRIVSLITESSTENKDTQEAESLFTSEGSEIFFSLFPSESSHPKSTELSDEELPKSSETSVPDLETSTYNVANETVVNVDAASEVTERGNEITRGGDSTERDNEVTVTNREETDYQPRSTVSNDISSETLPLEDLFAGTEEESKSPQEIEDDLPTLLLDNYDKLNESEVIEAIATSSESDSTSRSTSSKDENDSLLTSSLPSLEDSIPSEIPPLFLRPNDESLLKSIFNQIMKDNATDSDADDDEDADLEDEDEDDFEEDSDDDNHGGEVGLDSIGQSSLAEGGDDQDGEEGVDPEEKRKEEVGHDEGVEVGHHETAFTTHEDLEFSTHTTTPLDEERPDDVHTEGLPPTDKGGEPLSPENTEESQQEPDHEPSTEKPVSKHSRLHPALRQKGVRVHHTNRQTRDASHFNPNATSCTWVFKTEPGVPFLLTLKNYSVIEGDRCIRHHVAVQRSNGYEARWCGETGDKFNHATFARHELRLRFYTENHDVNIHEGFVVEVQALDMNLLRKAVSKVRPLYRRTQIT